jgi:hypothetical protein
MFIHALKHTNFFFQESNIKINIVLNFINMDQANIGYLNKLNKEANHLKVQKTHA